MSPYVLLGGVGVWVASVAGTAWVAYGAGRNAEIAKHATQEEIVRAVRVAMVDEAASAIAGISVKNTTIRQTLETKTREVPYPVDCRLQPDVLRLLNSTPGIAPAESAASGG